MTFISYAQNFEDVMLWRALKHVGEGFYIDVGAWSPEIDSVTRAFYEHGWRGISVEPNPEYHRQLQEVRSRDVNLRLALSDEPGSGSLNVVDNPGLSTMDDHIAQQHVKAGFSAEKIQVELATLDQVWEEHVPEGQDVHYLKIDVEGFEGRVIRGNDWGRHRPWIVVVEATVPMSQDESYSGWEPMLLENNYVMAYADGLNRFYVAREHDELRQALRYPPNYFDEFKQYRLVALEAELERSRQRAQEAENKARENWSRRLAERTEKDQLARQLADLNAAYTEARAELERSSRRAQEAENRAREFRNLRLEERAEKDLVAKKMADLRAEYTEARAELELLRQRLRESPSPERSSQKAGRDGESG